MTKQEQDKINTIGEQLGLVIPKFYGKIRFVYLNGKYIHSTVEQNIKPCNRD